METALTIAEVAGLTGVTAHTLRYYERAGLMLRSVGRAASAHRRYTADDVRWIVLLTKLRATGMPIRRVREYAALVRAGDGNERERLALLAAHRDAVVAQIAAMRDHLEAVERKIEMYEAHVAARRRPRTTAAAPLARG